MKYWIVLVLLLVQTPCSAEQSISEWFKQQHNAKGQSCCDTADGRRYDDYYQMNSDGSVTLAKNVKVESWKVLNGPNPTGHAILWTYGEHIYCFAPGPGF